MKYIRLATAEDIDINGIACDNISRGQICVITDIPMKVIGIPLSLTTKFWFMTGVITCGLINLLINIIF